MDKVDQNLKSLVRREEFKDLAKDVQDCATKFDLSIVEDGMKGLKKDYNGFMKLDDFAIKMNTIVGELDGKIMDRPTIKQTKQSLAVLDEKYDVMSKTLDE